MISSQYAGNLIEKEYYFGLSQFRDIVEKAEANLTETQLDFLSDGINMLVFFGENLTLQASEIFDNYGFVVDARQVYIFVSNVRAQIKAGIDRLMKNVTEVQIKREMQKSFEVYSMQLKEIFDKEIWKIYEGANHNYENLDCWDGYKVPILELGFNVVNNLRTLTSLEAAELTKAFTKLNQEVSSKLTQIVADLSTNHLTLLTTRSRVASYVSHKINSSPQLSGTKASSQARRLLFQIEDNQQKILDQIASWFDEIGSSIRRATINLQLGAEENVRVAAAQLDELSGEIVDCLVN